MSDEEPVKKCAGCLKTITSGRKSITCYLCERYYDLSCCGLSDDIYRKMNRSSRATWRCPTCQARLRTGGDNTNTPIRAKESGPGLPALDDVVPDMESIKNVIRSTVESVVQEVITKELKPIKTELVLLTDIQKSLGYVSNELDDIKVSLSKLKDENSSLLKENEKLKATVGDLSARVCLLEQHSRENNIEINGIPENKEENLHKTILQLGSTISQTISENEILSCTRVRKLDPTSNRPRSIIVKLPNSKTRDCILAAVAKFNRSNPSDKLNSKHLGYGGSKSPVFVSEHLSPHFKSLHAEARKLAREKGYRYTWVRNGRIFIRKNDTSPAKQIKDKESLKLIT